MKRAELIRTVRQAAQMQRVDFHLAKQGSNHEIWSCGGLRIPIPRHREIAETLAEEIFKEVEPKLGKRWWK